MFNDHTLVKSIESGKFDMTMLIRLLFLAKDGEIGVDNSDELVISNGDEAIRITGISTLSGSVKVQKS